MRGGYGLVVFFAISGFRAVFQFPAEPGSSWLFRITETRWAEISRSVIRRRVLVSGLARALLLLLPAEIACRRLLHGSRGLTDLVLATASRPVGSTLRCQ